MDKKEIRKQIRDLKKQYTIEDKKLRSVSVWEQMENDSHFKEARTVLVYWSMDDEVFTHDFIQKWADNKTILLPCVKGDELEIRYFENIGRLNPGESFGILEPVGALWTELDKIDAVIVPGIAFDGENNRLGRGKGYYDKVLKRTCACKIGVCFDFQFIECVPTDEYDVRMDKVIVSKK